MTPAPNVKAALRCRAATAPARTRAGYAQLYFSGGRLAVCQCVQDNTKMSEVLTIRVDRKTKRRLEKLARAMDRTRSYVAAEAIRAFVELNEWQIGEIKAALKEADAGDFASEGEVRTVTRKWRRGAGKVAQARAH